MRELSTKASLGKSPDDLYSPFETPKVPQSIAARKTCRPNRCEGHSDRVYALLSSTSFDFTKGAYLYRQSPRVFKEKVRRVDTK